MEAAVTDVEEFGGDVAFPQALPIVNIGASSRPGPHFVLEAYGYSLVSYDGLHRSKCAFVDRSLETIVRCWIGEGVDLKLKTNLDDIKRGDAEPAW